VAADCTGSLSERPGPERKYINQALAFHF